MQRELQEELGLEANKKLVWIAENFFKWQGYYAHEIQYVFKIELDEKLFEKYENFSILDSKTEKTKWIHKSELKNYVCKPNIIYDFFDEFEGIRHTVAKEYDVNID